MTLYRYEIEYSNSEGDETQVVLKKHEVVRETEKTYFIKKTQYPVLDNKLKRVLKAKPGSGSYAKRFAFYNRDDAMKNFIARTKTRISWYKFWTEECENATLGTNARFGRSNLLFNRCYGGIRRIWKEGRMIFTTQRGVETRFRPYGQISQPQREFILRDMLEIGTSRTKSKWNITTRTLGHIKFHNKKLLRKIEDENFERAGI